MKQLLRHRISLIASYIEIVLSVIITIGITYSIVKIITSIVLSRNFDYPFFLSEVLQLIIGIEFVKMLSKHTPGSVMDVLIFAAARKIIVTHYTGLELLLSVVSMAILFVVRKYISYSKS